MLHAKRYTCGRQIQRHVFTLLSCDLMLPEKLLVQQGSPDDSSIKKPIQQ